MLKNIFLIISLSLVSCSQKSKTQENDKIFINDPRQPGVVYGEGTNVRSVFNVKICPNLLSSNCGSQNENPTYNRVKLTWRVPSLYENEEYIIVIYKVNEETPIATEPGDLPNDLGFMSSFEQVRLKDTEWTDTVTQGSNYSYYIYVVLGGEETPNSIDGYWSKSSRYQVLTPTEGSSTNVPEAEKFWEKLVWENLTVKPTGDPEIIRYNTFSPGASSVEKGKGRIETAYNGAVTFISDTDNNRVLIYENAQLRNCEQYLSDEIQYFGCRLQAEGAPPTPYNILGQPEQGINLSCQEHQNLCSDFTTQSDCELTRNGIQSFCKWQNGSCKVQGNKCLSSPTDLLFNDGKLYVADSGNDRIMVYENVLYKPVVNNATEVLLGCDNKLPNQAKDTNPTRCQADRFYGRQSFDDFQQYSLENGEGISMLDNPNGLAIDGISLYIADTGNNRIVKLDNYNNPDEYDCNSSTWLTNLCSWDGLLGQSNYSEKKTFNDFFVEDPSILSGTFNNELQSRPDLLKRYCANPTKIKFKEIEGNNYMFIACNENFEATVGIGSKVGLKGRILRYDNNPIGIDFICNEATFDTGNCDADEVYGQETFDKIVVLSGASGGAGSYDTLAYTFSFVSDMDFVNDSLMLVDSTRNNIYVWKDLINKPADGFPYSYKAEDPEGKFISTSQSLPNLKRIQGFAFDDYGRIYITDGSDGKVYQLNLQEIPFE